MSVIPTAIVAGVWYQLARQGVTTQVIWLGLNILDSLRALRSTHSNGRIVGIKTRRRAMREAMLCWSAYVAIQQFGGIPDRVLGWVPLYPIFRAIFVSAFLLARLTFSEALYTSFIHPTLKRYETRIDLTLLLLHSIATLVYYFAVKTPFDKLHSLVKRYTWGMLRSGGPGQPTATDANTTMDTSLGSIVNGLDQDATTISVQNLPSTTTAGQKGSVRRQARKLEEEHKNSGPAVVSIQKSTPAGTARPISPYTSHFKQLASIAQINSVSSPHVGKKELSPGIAAMSSRQVSLRSVRSPAPTPELPTQEASMDVFGQAPDTDSLVHPVHTSVSAGSKRKLPVSTSSTIVASKRRVLESGRSLLNDTTKVNPLSQPPRRIPIARDANVPRATASLALGKSKSTLELRAGKPPSLAQQPSRPTKSAPTRRPLADATVTKAPSKRIPSTADRAKVIREAKRREETVELGDKRKPVRPIGPEGSKRTKVHIARD